ncbi:MAG: Gfo/Idh/MocA family oxidoreductase [Chloroflexota bacterium]
MSIRIAISGTGYIAKIHAIAVQNCGAELTAVVNHRTESMEPFAQQFRIPRKYTTVEELIHAGGVDALVICTPNYLHASQTTAALRAGIHVMVEKPMAMNALEAARMEKISQDSGTLLMLAHCWRFDKEVLWLKSQIKQLGKIIRTKSYGVHVNWGPSGWFTQKKFAGGGALADMGIHALDTTRFLLDDPLPVRVYARIGTYYRDFDVDDTGVVIVSWEDGNISYIESGWWQPHADGPEAATQLYGTKGFGQIFPTRMKMGEKLVDPGFPHPRSEHCPQSMYDDQMAYFLDCIQSGKKPNPGGQEGLINMRVIDAAYKSAQTGRVVAL